MKTNAYSTEGGLSPEQLVKAVGLIKKKYPISALAFTAYDPSCDPEAKVIGVVKAVLEALI